MLTSLLFYFSAACTSSDAEDSAQVSEVEDVSIETQSAPIEPITIIGVMPVSGERAVLLESLAIESSRSIALNGYQTLHNVSEVWSVVDEAIANTIELGAFGVADGLSIDDYSSMLVLDGEVTILTDGTLQTSPVNEVLPVPAEQVFGTPESMWFWGAGRLYNVANETVVELHVANHDISDFVFGPLKIHALTLPELQLIEKGENGFEGIDHRSDVLPETMVFDRTGTLWVSDGSEILYQRNGNRIWSGLELEEPIVLLLGSEHSADLWIQTESAVFHHRSGEFYQVNLPEGEWMDVDEYGRLLILTEMGIQRVSIERTVVVTGLRPNSSLEGIRELIFLPMLEESLESLNVWIDQIALTLDDHRTVVDANDYSAGVHTLRMVATGEEGTSITEVPFLIGELPDVAWDGDIDLLSQRHCNDCHGEASFLPLHTSEQWEENISLILSEVLGNEMPKGGPYLSAEEIQMIRGWQNGGFQ